MVSQMGRLPFRSHLKISSVTFFFNFEWALWTDSSVTADIHTAKFVVSVSIKPHLQRKEKVHEIKAMALGQIASIHVLAVHVLKGIVGAVWSSAGTLVGKARNPDLCFAALALFLLYVRAHEN